MWTPEKITHLLKTNDRAVERAIVVIFDRQTQDEKATSETRHTNHRGFRSNHASKGSYYARWINSGRRLTGGHLANARKIALQYTRQLCEEANARIIDKQEDAREKHKANFAEDSEQAMMRMEVESDRTGTARDEANKSVARSALEGPMPGTLAYSARMMVQLGLMTGEEADDWKDMMKDETSSEFD